MHVHTNLIRSEGLLHMCVLQEPAGREHMYSASSLHASPPAGYQQVQCSNQTVLVAVWNGVCDSLCYWHDIGSGVHQNEEEYPSEEEPGKLRVVLREEEGGGRKG